MGGRQWRRVAVGVALLAAAACGGDGGESTDENSAELERFTLAGVSFGLPPGWTPCEFRGNVLFGRLVEVRPDYWDAGTPPLSIQVNVGVESYDQAMELDRASFGQDAEVSTESIDVEGAADATMVEFEGAAFGFDFAGMSVYAYDGDETTVKVTWYSEPDDVESGREPFDAVVDSLDFEATDDDSDFDTCAKPG